MSKVEQQSSHPQNGLVLGLGISGLVVGILAALISLIPCAGAFAIYPGILAVLLSGVAVGVGMKNGTSHTGLAIAALVISVLAVGKGAFEWKRAHDVGNQLQNSVEEGVKDLEKKMQENLDEMKKKAEE
ncbi:MAG: hypothetical protein KDB14_18445 [Planctomycetales bacterium]|nr:hypothetical protein [Planctomycetales bacterium]